MGRPQSLPQGVTDRQVTQFACEQSVVAQLQAGLCLVLQGQQPLFLPAGDRGARERLVREVREGGAPPQRQGVGEEVGAFLVVRGGAGPCGERREPARVHRFARHREQITGGAMKHRLGGSGAREHPAQAGDQGLQGARGVGRRGGAPQLVDQPVGGDHLPGRRQQIRQQSADLRLRHRHGRSVVGPDGERPQHP
jgi:hypothetical protein